MNRPDLKATITQNGTWTNSATRETFPTYSVTSHHNNATLPTLKCYATAEYFAWVINQRFEHN